MSKVYILGAGCSRNYTQGINAKNGLLSPLDRDFFRMAKKMVLARGSDYMFYGDPPLDHFLRDLGKLYGYNRLPREPINLFDNSRLSLESVMTTFALRDEIFEKSFHIHGYPTSFPSTSANRLVTLKELIAQTIAEAHKGPTCEKHLKLAESMQRGDIVLSYNYDILIENALRQAGKFTDDGYIINFYNVFDEGHWVKPQHQESQIRVAKLHGSLNWLRCSFCGSNQLLRRQKIGRWHTSVPRECCPKCKADTNYWERLLVPPLLTKSYNDPAINYLWLEAERMLHEAEEVVVIGYSMPRADFASETLLRIGLGDRARQIPVTIVDPSSKVKSRFAAIFNSSKISKFKDLNHYLRSNA